MEYYFLKITGEINIESIISIHYFEYSSTFYFKGESHNFWEFLYVDKGEVLVTSDKDIISLKKGNIIFHKPNEFHNVKANGEIAPNLIVISFDCNSPSMSFFDKKITSLSEEEKNILAKIIFEAKSSFSSPLDNPYNNKLTLKENIPFASLQTIKNLLELFLIDLIRKNSNNNTENDIQKKYNNNKINLDTYNSILKYLEDNITQHLTVDKISKDNLIGKSHLQKIFKEKSNFGIIEYFSKMKIEEAKFLIRTNKMNFTEISNYLGYTSIHYFSRQFKKNTGMSPSEYASSVKCISETIIE